MVKKNLFDFSVLRNQLKTIKNSLSEKGQSVIDGLFNMLDAIEAQAKVNDFTDEELKKLIQDGTAEALKVLEAENEQKRADEVRDIVSNMLKNRAGYVQLSNNITWKQLNRDLRNSLVDTHLKGYNRQEILNSVHDLVVRNSIGGLTFGGETDFRIVDDWGDKDPLFKRFTRDYVSQIFYTTQELNTANIIAKKYDRSATGNKKEQVISVDPKTVRTDYVVSLQSVSQADLDEVNRLGKQAEFIEGIDSKLERTNVASCLMAILVGDNVNTGDDVINTFETIGTKTQSDAWTTVLTETGDITIESMRQLCDSVHNPYNRDKVLIVNSQLYSKVAKYTIANTATMWHSLEEFAAQVGVSEVIFNEWLDVQTGIMGICMIPEDYHIVQKNAINVSYTVWRENKLFLQKERNIGGGIYGLKSTAVLKK